MMRTVLKIVGTAWLAPSLLLALVGCNTSSEDGRPTIVVTHSILGDVVEQVVGGQADAYADEVRAADAAIEQQLATIPEARRMLVTNHEVFGYFADRYGFDIVGTVIPSGTTLAEPSSAELADLVQVIDDAGVPAIFADTSSSNALAQTLADETGEDVQVVELFTESLGEAGSGGATYLELVQTNADRITEALT